MILCSWDKACFQNVHFFQDTLNISYYTEKPKNRMPEKLVSELKGGAFNSYAYISPQTYDSIFHCSVEINTEKFPHGIMTHPI